MLLGQTEGYHAFGYSGADLRILFLFADMERLLRGIRQIRRTVLYQSFHPQRHLSNGNRTQKILTEQCFLPKQTVNAVITSFYKKGWVELRELPEDRRNKTVQLTEAGRTAVEPILQRAQQSEQLAMSRLTEEERAVLLSATRRYVTECREAMKGL